MFGASNIDDVHNYCDETKDLRLFFCSEIEIEMTQII